MTKEKIEQVLNEANVHATIELVDSATTKGDWECRKWTVEFESEIGRASFKYYTGMAITSPDISGVIESLLMDAEYTDLNFDYWCSSIGYDPDSIANWKTYKGCKRNSRKLKRIFTSEQLEKLANIVAEG